MFFEWPRFQMRAASFQMCQVGTFCTHFERDLKRGGHFLASVGSFWRPSPVPPACPLNLGQHSTGILNRCNPNSAKGEAKDDPIRPPILVSQGRRPTWRGQNSLTHGHSHAVSLAHKFGLRGIHSLVCRPCIFFGLSVLVILFCEGKPLPTFFGYHAKVEAFGAGHGISFPSRDLSIRS